MNKFVELPIITKYVAKNIFSDARVKINKQYEIKK